MAGANNRPNEMTSILNFRIFHVTSQDHEYPAQDLVSLGKAKKSMSLMDEGDFKYGNSNSYNNMYHKLNGWQSQRFCTYPQEIVLQFDKSVHLTQVQFLIHEKKISSMIELHTCNPK